MVSMGRRMSMAACDIYVQAHCRELRHACTKRLQCWAAGSRCACRLDALCLAGMRQDGTPLLVEMIAMRESTDPGAQHALVNVVNLQDRGLSSLRLAGVLAGRVPELQTANAHVGSAALRVITSKHAQNALLHQFVAWHHNLVRCATR